MQGILRGVESLRLGVRALGRWLRVELHHAQQGFRDGWTWAAWLVGLLALGYTPDAVMPSLWRLVFVALIEEAVFRMLLQQELDSWLKTFSLSQQPLFTYCTLGNILISALFATLHLITQTPLMALLVFFPSLVFGVLWTRHHSLLLCALMHYSYNLCFFLSIQTFFS